MVKNIKEVVSDLPNIEFSLRNNIGIDSSETFGIEIEFENANLDEIKASSKWIVKPDDSVTVANHGGELVSPILIDHEDCWKQIKNKCNYLKNKQATVTTKTAAHIHIGSQILKNDPNNIKKFLKTWELFENIIFYFSYGKDSNPRSTFKKFSHPVGTNLYRIRNSKRGYNWLNSYYDWHQFFKKYGLDKYAAINFNNYKGDQMDDKNTIEIRCPNGTLDAMIWQNNINFFTKLMISVTNDNFDEELIDYYLAKKEFKTYGFNNVNLIDIDSALILVDIVFDKDIDKLLFLKQYLKLFDNEKTYKKNKNHSV